MPQSKVVFALSRPAARLAAGWGAGALALASGLVLLAAAPSTAEAPAEAQDQAQAEAQSRLDDGPRFASSGDPGFDAWREGFAVRAIAAGRSPAITEQLLTGLTPDARAVRQDQTQPEFNRPWWDYVDRAVTQSRIDRGRVRISQDASVFEAVAARYGVDPGVIAGIWGVESNFGDAALPHEAPRVLATLAYEGRRRGDFERWLMALIEMVERGYAGPSELRSSWAGALGQPQFMPDVYLTRAVDWDGDGRRDIWANDADIIASIANYLAEAGWRRGEPVFQEVRLPPGFDLSLADRTMRPISAYAERGAAPVAGSWVNGDASLGAELFLPAGLTGPALLLHANFSAIRRYNPSDRYALAVALLGARLDGGQGLWAPWPSHLRTLSVAMVRELQTGLNALGHDAGAVDGVVGAGTRRGLRSFQLARGAPADGFPTYAMLEEVRQAQNPLPDGRLSAAETADLQRRLVRLGFRVGRADGVAGARTRAAITAFERSLGRPETTGLPTSRILAAARAFAP